MEFDEYDGRNATADRPVDLRIYAGGNQATVTAGAVEEYFTRYGSPVDEVGYLTNTDKSVIAFDPEGESGDTFTLTISDGSGALAVKGVLAKAFDVDIDDISTKHVLDLETDDETGFVVADLKPVVEDATDDVHCPKCGKRCAGEPAMKNHASRVHDGPQALYKRGELEAEDDVVPDGDDSWKEIDEKARADGGDA
ncbi:hypothetical protein Hbl1158_10320 [Halobaculum sp. CBA1158]|uniref:hypothetical protein n=1 Tax=Halobaculum sp. CBA1158 TaxID=2904243 RepID=UPI001F431FF9|nr:hypothetical protein [Halobaculum sp. CBA1158]UIO98929.1 hypothetical protein Hbl1158_10320 [Halobaculum sp. CBA1158]